VKWKPIYVLVGEVAKARGIFDQDYKVASRFDLEVDLEKKGLKLVLFLDELQEMYPVLGIAWTKGELYFKRDFMLDISSFCNGGCTLVIAAGNSVSLSDLLYLQASRDERVG
jgi:hypothetical protein